MGNLASCSVIPSVDEERHYNDLVAMRVSVSSPLDMTHAYPQ